jgi:hypothetical protein
MQGGRWNERRGLTTSGGQARLGDACSWADDDCRHPPTPPRLEFLFLDMMFIILCNSINLDDTINIHSDRGYNNCDGPRGWT